MSDPTTNTNLGGVSLSKGQDSQIPKFSVQPQDMPTSPPGSDLTQSVPSFNPGVTSPTQDTSSLLTPTPADPVNPIGSEQSSPPANLTPEEAVVTSPHTPSKYRGKKIIATIFGIALLVGGVAAGVILVQRAQEYRERAASGSECQHDPDCELLDNPGNRGSYTAPRTITHIFITAKDYVRFDPPGKNDGCYDVDINDRKLEWERVGDGPNCKDISNIQVWLGPSSQPTPTATPSPAPTSTPIPTLPPNATATPTLTSTPTPTIPPDITATCGNVVAYDENWNLLSANDLSSLQPGDTVRFAVSGTTSSGTIDKARFTINGNLRPEVNSKKPGTSEFYDEYQVPQGVSTFNVSGQLYHSSLGWF